MKFIDLEKQQSLIRDKIDLRIKQVLDHGRYIMGPEVVELEDQLAQFSGSKHVITCANGTDALQLALMAWGIAPGDAVFTTAFSFFATAEVISLLGATPVFVDIDPVSYNLDSQKLWEAVQYVEAKTKLKPRAVIAVDLFGLPADYEGIREICDKKSLKLLQDGAQGFGARYKSTCCPLQGDIGTTSFFPAKPLGCYGDGGALFTNDDSLATRLKSLRIHGKGQDKYDNIYVGMNSRLDTIQAAILLEKLSIYQSEIDQRQIVASKYLDLLIEYGDESLLAVPAHPYQEQSGSLSVFAQFSIRIAERDNVQLKLKEQDIPSMVYYPTPMHLLAAIKEVSLTPFQCIEAEKASKEILALPFHPYIQESEQEKVVKAIFS